MRIRNNIKKLKKLKFKLIIKYYDFKFKCKPLIFFKFNKTKKLQVIYFG